MYYMQYTSSITSKGTITIPAVIRRDLGLTQGSRVTFTVENGVVSIQPLPNLQELRARNKTYLQKNGMLTLKQVPNDYGFDLYVKEKYGIE